DARVLAAMLPYFTEKFGNPHSRQHEHGRIAERAVETARAQVAALIGADPKEVIFTSGATESNNLALKGVARFHRERKDHLVTCVTEHKCVLESARRLEREGFAVTYLPVAASGLIDLDRLAEAITERTALVSIMAVNNEIGVIQPLAEIGALCRARGVPFHTDAAQAVGKIPLDVAAMNIDLMSISGHKTYGPKGIGALYVRRRPRVRLEPLIDGGGQERGLRSGTLPTPLCVGLGEACAIAGREMAAEAARLRALRDRLHDGIAGGLADVALHGDRERRIAGNLNLGFAGIDSEALMADLPDLAISSGSACASAALEPSYVLRALGVDETAARGAVRLGLGRFTTEAEVDFAAERLVAAVRRRRAGGARNPAAAE
ncbi:MAG TPA: aminotransferase class V-fold PLP-dependent enzyme, partial [Dongiaceae bacterium]|nr:aminotransferase class V-fold PLP-dependent enzyme [Dongiaceae bacterium]